MIFFGHVGITAGLVQAVNNATGRKVDLRKAAVLGIAPDLLDKPVALLYSNVFGNHTRLWAHSLVFTLACWVILKLNRRSSTYAGIYAGAYLGHLFLDRLWIQDRYSLFWPLLPFPPPEEITILHKWANGAVQPWSIFGEITGISILAFLFFRYRLHRRDNLACFLKTGLMPHCKNPCQSASSQSKSVNI